MKTLLVFAIVTIAGSVAIAVFTLLKYEHLKHRHRLSGAMATAHMGAAMLLIAILPAGLGQSIEGNQGRRVWAYDDPRWLTIEKWLAGGCVLLLA